MIPAFLVPLMPLAKKYWWVALAVLAAAAGWIARGKTMKPIDQKTLDRIELLEQTANDYEKETASRNAALVELAAQVAQAEEESRRASTTATQLRASSAANHRRATALEEDLQNAESLADSVPILLKQKTELTLALDNLNFAFDTLHNAYGTLQTANRGLHQQLDTLQVQRSVDSARVALQDLIIKGLIRAKAPCGEWCPTLIGTYDIQNKAISAGAGVRPRSWLTLGVTYRLTPKP